MAVGARPVCRFYGTPGIGPNSHFYTADADKCAAGKLDRGWTYEGTAFYVSCRSLTCAQARRRVSEVIGPPPSIEPK